MKQEIQMWTILNFYAFWIFFWLYPEFFKNTPSLAQQRKSPPPPHDYHYLTFIQPVDKINNKPSLLE